MQSINTSPDTPEKPSESIQKSMDLADLQVKVMNFKMSEATIEGIDALFKGFDDDETAQKLKENMHKHTTHLHKQHRSLLLVKNKIR